MKIRTILVSMLTIAVLAGCTKEKEPAGKTGGDGDVAYMSIKIQKEQRTRDSSEDDGDPEESEFKSLYMLLFDGSGTIVPTPGGVYYESIPVSSATPDPVKVLASAKQLLLVANPGPKLLAVITGINNPTTHFETLNAALKAAGTVPDPALGHTEVTGQGFAMINSGKETQHNDPPEVNDVITEWLIDISGKIFVASETKTEAEAIQEAKDNRVEVKIERLSSKVGFAIKLNGGNPAIDVEPAGATFVFGKWTLDALNSTYYPWAKKTLLSVTHSGTGHYVKNFYTEDPNFTTSDGIRKATIGADFAPVLPTTEGWMDAPNKTYCIENTMAAAEQLFGIATRVVIKGTYYPEDYAGAAGGDWFSFAGENYSLFSDLTGKYATAGANLKAACDNFYDKVYAYLDNKTGGPDLTDIDDFGDLTQALLDEVENGGEVVKNGKNPVIRWHQKGLSYYYYEIRHDNSPTAGKMAFAKYGVVRNNHYSLTLGKVIGSGTPWYPDIDNPGPGDPDPTDPIDPVEGYLGIDIKIAPWILWENEITVGQ